MLGGGFFAPGRMSRFPEIEIQSRSRAALASLGLDLRLWVEHRANGLFHQVNNHHSFIVAVLILF